jgi:hypothetical protein
MPHAGVMPTIAVACEIQKLIEVLRHMHNVGVFAQSIVLSIIGVEMSNQRSRHISYVLL